MSFTVLLSTRLYSSLLETKPEMWLNFIGVLPAFILNIIYELINKSVKDNDIVIKYAITLCQGY